MSQPAVNVPPPANDADLPVIVQLNPNKWIKPTLLPTVTGYTVEAARKMCERGKWLEGVHFKHDGRSVLYNREAIDQYHEAL